MLKMMVQSKAPVEVTLPYHFVPRGYQLPIFEYMNDDLPGKRAVLVWHRRAGKDKSILNVVCKEMFKRVGNYYYFFPTYKQGRMALWEAVDKDGFKVMQHIPEQIRLRTNDTTMFLETVNHSTLQVIGTENFDRIVGTNPVGCVFSEYSLQNPAVWSYMSPILAENDGWAIFNFTPRGKNHGYDILQVAQEEGWFWQVLTVDDTHAISQIALEQERTVKRKTTGSDSLFLQEFYCDFTVPIAGAYYEEQIFLAEKEKRVGIFPHTLGVPVHTVWDIGVGDKTAIWFFQLIGNDIRIIDYHENNGKGIEYYAKYLQSKPYVYGDHYAPHDIRNREWTADGSTRKEVAEKLGIDFRIVPSVSLEDGIAAARLMFDRCFFNVVPGANIEDPGVQRGLDALKFYHKEYDEDKHIYNDRPEHDWSSHAADGFRYLALSVGLILGDFQGRDSEETGSEEVEEDNVYE